MKQLLVAGALFFSLIFFFSIPANALVADSDLYGINFYFNNPGARSNGMGGAFIGLADDATAAYTNPAGLTVLTQPEISVEYKYGKYTTVINDATGQSEYDNSVDDVSFLSFAYPREKVTITIFRHKFIDIENTFKDYVAENNLPTYFITQYNNNIDVETLGAGFGIKLTDSFSLGMSIGFDNLNYKLFAQSISVKDLETTVNDSGSDIHFTASVLWNPFQQFNIGLVYRQGPEFDTRKIGLIYNELSEIYLQEYNQKNTLKIPDVIGIGMSYCFFSSFTMAIDVNYIEYSDLLDDLRFPDDNVVYINDIINGSIYLDDETEVHIGFEYIFNVKNTPFAVRGGYYFRPEHRIKYSGREENFREMLKEGEDDHIFSLGFGTVFADNIQMDMAASFGDLSTEYTMSLVYRFD